jgi:hypothetical protein
MSTLASQYEVIDTNIHITEPYDLFTARGPVAKWGDKVPHVRWNESEQEESRFFGDERIQPGQAQAPVAGRPGRPGPASAAINPRDHIEQMLAGLPDPTIGKLLHANAARAYRLE